MTATALRLAEAPRALPDLDAILPALTAKFAATRRTFWRSPRRSSWAGMGRTCRRR
jgi:hypothetical protein